MNMPHLSEMACVSCGAGHAKTPCRGGNCCMCRCRRCDAPFNHQAEALPTPPTGAAAPDAGGGA